MSEPQSDRARALRGLLASLGVLTQRARTAIAEWFLLPFIIAATWLDGLDDWAAAVEDN